MTFAELVVKRMKLLIETADKKKAWEMEAVAEMMKAAHLLSAPAQVRQDLEKIADVIEPHWRGAGLNLTADWIIDQFIKLGDAVDAQIPEVECAHRTLDKWNPNRADYIGDTPYTLDDRIDALLEDMNASAQRSSLPTQALLDFFKWAMREGPWDGGDLDGGSVQDKAEALGLIVKTQYDAERHGVQSEFEDGDDWFEYAPSLVSSTTRVSAAEILGDPLGGVSIPSTHQRCAKCGCETKGEAALVDGKIWCHPCADISTPRATPPLCGCKASQRDGQHMAWCPAISSTARGTP